MKHVYLILSYKIGEYPDEDCSKNVEDWEDTFYQSDVNTYDFSIIDVYTRES